MTYDALAFLTELFHADSPVDLPDEGGESIRVEDLDMDWRMVFEERAAIMEYDGGLPRERAEAEALADTIRAMRGEAEMEEDAKKFRNLVDTGEA